MIILDENLQLLKNETPPHVINAVQYLRKNGHDKGAGDYILLDLAKKNGDTLVTKDQKMVIRAMIDNISIVFVCDEGCFQLENSNHKEVSLKEMLKRQ